MQYPKMQGQGHYEMQQSVYKLKGSKYSAEYAQFTNSTELQVAWH